MGSVLNRVGWASLPFALQSAVRIIALVVRRRLITSPGLSGLWADGQALNVVALAYLAGQAANSGDSPPPTVAAFTPLWLPVAALVFATLIGLLSGLYPALRAARLAPSRRSSTNEAVARLQTSPCSRFARVPRVVAASDASRLFGQDTRVRA
jgi:hypothetical protein